MFSLFWIDILLHQMHIYPGLCKKEKKWHLLPALPSQCCQYLPPEQGSRTCEQWLVTLCRAGREVVSIAKISMWAKCLCDAPLPYGPPTDVYKKNWRKNQNKPNKQNPNQPTNKNPQSKEEGFCLLKQEHFCSWFLPSLPQYLLYVPSLWAEAWPVSKVKGARLGLGDTIWLCALLCLTTRRPGILISTWCSWVFL